MRVGEEELVCDAGVSLHLLQPFVHQQLPADEYDSLGGLILDIAGEIPQVSESFSYGNLALIVEEIDGPRLVRIRVLEHTTETDTEP